jgi:hypothetical protein
VDLTGIWQNRVEWQVNGSKRWELIRWDDETGGNSGSNLYVNSYNDAGNFIAPVLAITRSNGNITASGSVSIGGALTMGGNINMNGRSINNVDQLNASGYVQASDANQRLQVLAGRLIYTNATGVRTFEISHQGLDMLGIIRFDNAGNPVTDGNVFNISRLDGTVSFRSANVQFINMRTTTPQAGSRELWADPADGYRVKWVP